MLSRESGMRLIRAESPRDIACVKALFLDYARSLDFSLCFQGFDEEMAGFPGRYAPPAGSLLLASLDGAAAGAVGLRALEDGACEMKRLYVQPEFRGRDLGRELVFAVLEEGRRLGYRVMRLDTLPSMAEAIALYRDAGFTEIEPYTHNPLPGVTYFERPLR